MRPAALLPLLLGAGLLGLLILDRKSALALYAVEYLGSVGYVVGLGLILVGLAQLWPRGPRKAPPAPPPARSPAPAPLPSGGDWLAALRQAAAALPLERGVKLQIDPLAEIPIQLQASRLTPEQLRRTLDTLAGFLSVSPLPARVKLELRDCPPSQTTRQTELSAALRRKGVASPFTALEHGEAVELRFSAPDPRWAVAGGRS